MQKLIPLFLYVFLADGLISLASTVGHLHVPGVANTIGILLLLLTLIFFTGVVVTPRLRKRILLPPIIFVGLNIILEILFGQKAELGIAITETVLALGIFIGFGQWSGWRWLINGVAESRPAFTWKNFWLTGLLNGLLTGCLFLVLALGLVRKARNSLEESTGGYAIVRPSGISLQERRFQRAGKEVRLVSMVHIARSDFYSEVANTLPTNQTAVVMLEGFTDRQHLLRGKFGYSHLAWALGIASQTESSFSQKAIAGMQTSSPAPEGAPSQLEYRSGDVDIAIFSAGTVRYLNALGTILDSKTPTEALQHFTDSKDIFVQDSNGVLADVLYKRNAHLLGEIDTALSDHNTVVVPWGAYHMAALQRALQERGFVETKRMEHQAVPFRSRPLICLVTLLDRLGNR